MDSKYNFFVFETSVPMNLTKGAIYITPYGEDYVNIFRSITQYEKNVGEIIETEDNKNIFIDRGVYSSAIDFRIKNPTLPRESIFIQTDISVRDIYNKIKYNESLGMYDVFSGKETLSLNESDYEDLYKNKDLDNYQIHLEILQP